MSDSTLSALSNIRTKVRRLTRNPSTSQLSNDDLDSYINNFILYDMPAHIKLDALETVLTFYTSPNEDTYSTNTADSTNPLYNFKNKYTNVGEPVYIAGNRATFSQTLDEFYALYPLTESKINIGTGDGVTVNFTGTLDNIPILKGRVSASSIDSSDDPLLLTEDGSGSFEGDVGAPSTIDYLTGVYDITFDFAPEDGETVWMQTRPYVANRPSSLLFFEDQFTVRPVPDGAYRIDIKAYVRPTEMDDAADLPLLSEWWQYIAYGASISLLYDRLDIETIALLKPEFEKQQILIGRRKIVQNSGKRTATIFTSGYINYDDFKGDK